MKAPELFSINPLYHSRPLRGPKLLGLEWSSRWTYLEQSKYNSRAGLELIEYKTKIFRLQLRALPKNYFYLWCSSVNTFDFWQNFAKNIFNLSLCASILVPLCMRFHFGSTVRFHFGTVMRIQFGSAMRFRLGRTMRWLSKSQIWSVP